MLAFFLILAKASPPIFVAFGIESVSRVELAKALSPILVASGKMLKGNFYQKILAPLRGILKYTAPEKQKIIAMSHQSPKKFPRRRRRWFGFRDGDRQKVRAIMARGIKKALRA